LSHNLSPFVLCFVCEMGLTDFAQAGLKLEILQLFPLQ
jgi:hypothetical protein